MKYLHTMIRVSNIEESLRFFCEGLGLKETRRKDSEKGRYTLVFLAAPDDEKAEIKAKQPDKNNEHNNISKKMNNISKTANVYTIFKEYIESTFEGYQLINITNKLNSRN